MQLLRSSILFFLMFLAKNLVCNPAKNNPCPTDNKKEIAQSKLEEEISPKSILSKRIHWISLDLFLNTLANFSRPLSQEYIFHKIFYKNTDKKELKTREEFLENNNELKLILKYFSGLFLPDLANLLPKCISEKISSEIETEIKYKLTEYLLTKPNYEFFEKNATTDFNEQIDSISNSLASFSYKLNSVIIDILKICWGLKKTFVFEKNTFFEWGLLLGCYPILSSLTKSDFYKDYNLKKSSLNQRMNDLLKNIKTVKLYTSEKEELLAIKKELIEIEKELKKETLNQRLAYFQINTVYKLIETALFWLLLKNTNLSIPDIFSKLNNKFFLYSAISSIPESIKALRENYKTLEAKKELFFSFKKEMENDSLLPKIKIKKGEMCFKNIVFKRENGNFVFSTTNNFKIHAHEKIGIVGKSGSGKTTFINLILRLLELNEGQILIDGQDISKYSRASLYENIAVVSQEPAIFSRSIADNIRYGKPDATDEEVFDAAKKADIHDFIVSLPNGYNEILGSNGMVLSGGQSQRIGIARAFLKNAPILILDEATSALDSITENTIKASLNKLMENKTTIIIAHRYSTLSDVDCILVFQDGKIVERGSHVHLMENGPIYQSLWQAQHPKLNY